MVSYYGKNLTINGLDLVEKLIEWLFGWSESLWCFLPDKCEMKDCCRMGVRGNENIVDGQVVCDFCSAKFIKDKIIKNDK